jgi:hypothetical protein
VTTSSRSAARASSGAAAQRCQRRCTEPGRPRACGPDAAQPTQHGAGTPVQHLRRDPAGRSSTLRSVPPEQQGQRPNCAPWASRASMRYYVANALLFLLWPPAVSARVRFLRAGSRVRVTAGGSNPSSPSPPGEPENGGAAAGPANPGAGGQARHYTLSPVSGWRGRD